jgi:hypothetical protein
VAGMPVSSVGIPIPTGRGQMIQSSMTIDPDGSLSNQDLQCQGGRSRYPAIELDFLAV